MQVAKARGKRIDHGERKRKRSFIGSGRLGRGEKKENVNGSHTGGGERISGLEKERSSPFRTSGTRRIVEEHQSETMTRV